MTFELRLKEMMIESYILVYGEEKWNSLTNDEKDMVLHLLLKDLCKRAGV